MIEKKCKTCRFWECWEKPEKVYKEGYCHRHAPVSGYADTEIHAIRKATELLLWWTIREWKGDPDEEFGRWGIDAEDGWKCTCWPHTSEGDWCGEWEVKKEQEAKQEAA